VAIDQIWSKLGGARSVIVGDADGNTITLLEDPARPTV